MWNIDNRLIPKRGLLVAYLTGELLFEPYEVVDGRIVFEGSEAYEDALPYECHLFDADTEYRLVRRESRGDVVERVLSRLEEEAMDADLVFEEEPLLKDEYAARPGVADRIRVVSRYAYTQNDTLVLKNYRMATVGEVGA